MPVSSILEHHFIYFPQARYAATPAKVGLRYEEISFPATDGTRLTGWLIPGPGEAPVVLFCMGNAGNISHRIETLQLLHGLGVATFIFNYRGYGQSAGKASETGTYADAVGAMSFLQERGWPTSRIVIFGRSLGAAVGLETALRCAPAGLIMESAFTSIAEMGRHHYPLLNRALGPMITARYDNLGKIGRLKRPLLLLHGEADTTCPAFMASQLYARAPDRKKILWIDGAGHNDGFWARGPAYRRALQQFLLDWTGDTEQNRARV